LVVLFMPKMFEVIKCYGDTILREHL
jgi:hypothetical protein